MFSNEEREWNAVAAALGTRRNGEARSDLISGSVNLRADVLPREFARAGAGARVRPQVDSALIERTLRDLHAMGASILYPEHPLYPAEFYELEKPPPFLSVVGNASVLHAPKRLAVVGSRELSGRTERWLEHHLPSYLKTNDVVIVSGGARGADQAAHLAAIRTGRATAVFLPCGLARLFPADLEEWVKPVLDAGGVFVSAYAPEETVRKFRFEGRNRLIASVSHGVFVAEASRRSGSMMTARISGELGREIGVLPSAPGDLTGQGSLDLMANGATMIRDALDLQVFVDRLVPGASQRPGCRDREESVGRPHRDVRRQLSFS